MVHQELQAGCRKARNLLLSDANICALRDESLQFDHFFDLYGQNRMDVWDSGQPSASAKLCALLNPVKCSYRLRWAI